MTSGSLITQKLILPMKVDKNPSNNSDPSNPSNPPTIKPFKPRDMKKEFLDDELDNISPWLRDMKRRDDGFRLPEGYFEALETSVLSRIDESGARRETVFQARKGGKFFRPQMIWAAAAAAAMVLTTTWLILSKTSQTITTSATTQELTEEEELEAYVLENIHDFEEAQLASVPVNEHPHSETKPSLAPQNKPGEPDAVDNLSEEELELLLKEMSEEELENLLKT